MKKVTSLMILLCLIIGQSSFAEKGKQKKKNKSKKMEVVKNKKKITTSNATIFGIDISEYQGDIHWNKKLTTKKNKRVKFVIMRATMGDRKDDKFVKNFREAKKHGYIVGAYHYYDPNQNSTLQTENYIKTIKLKKGDFIPIVDLERFSSVQSFEKLKQGLQNCLNILEKKYKVKPILYTGYGLYEKYFSKDFSGYPLWVAAWEKDKRNTCIVRDCEIHQFCESVSIKGIAGLVDGDDIKARKLASLRIK